MVGRGGSKVLFFFVVGGLAWFILCFSSHLGLPAGSFGNPLITPGGFNGVQMAGGPDLSPMPKANTNSLMFD